MKYVPGQGRITTSGLQTIAKQYLPPGVTLSQMQASVLARVANGPYSIHRFARSFKPALDENFVTACLVTAVRDEEAAELQREQVAARRHEMARAIAAANKGLAFA